MPTVGEIYAENAKFVWRNLRRLGVPAELIEDAVQDVFLVVHRRLEGFEQRSSLRTWLFGIVFRVASRYRERQKAKDERYTSANPTLLDAVVASSHSGPLDLVAQRQAADLLYDTLSTLKEDKRIMIVMVELEQMSVAEAAQVLDINLNTAYGRLKRARRDLEKQLQDMKMQRRQS